MERAGDGPRIRVCVYVLGEDSLFRTAARFREWYNPRHMAYPTIPVINPANETVIGEVTRGTARHAADAVDAARAAFRKWRWVPAIERAAMLHAVAAKLRAGQQELATTMTLEGGKPFCENRDEVEWTAACFDYYAEIG